MPGCPWVAVPQPQPLPPPPSMQIQQDQQGGGSTAAGGEEAAGQDDVGRVLAQRADARGTGSTSEAERDAEQRVVLQACHATVMGMFEVELKAPKQVRRGITACKTGVQGSGVSGDGWSADLREGIDVEELAHLSVIYGGEDQAMGMWNMMQMGQETRGEPSKQPLFSARTAYAANKARVVHTANNPTPGMLDRDPALAARWKGCTNKEFGGGIAKGVRAIITEEEKVRDGWVAERMVVVYSTKRDGREKCRAASDGSRTPKSFFDEDYLYAEGLPMAVMRLLTAFFKYFRMRDRTTDVEGCFAAENKWDLSPYPRLICHRLSAYQSPTGREEWMANLTNNYGGRDGPGQWRAISTDVLVNRCGFQQSVVCKQLFLKFAGERSLLVLGQTTDDFKLGHTEDVLGQGMYTEVMRVLQEEMGWVMTEQNPTEDYGSLRHEFADIEGRAAVTLTQPAQIGKLVEAIFGPGLDGITETLLPLPATWSAVMSVRCREEVPVRDYMSALMSASWITQTRFESPAMSLLACRSQRPTQVDMEAVRSHAAYLHTTRDLGLTYYEGPKDADIRKTVGLRLY